MAQDNIRNLYDALKGEYDLGSEQDFRKSLKDAGNRRNLYEAIRDEYDVGSEEDFNGSLGYGAGGQAGDAGAAGDAGGVGDAGVVGDAGGAGLSDGERRELGAWASGLRRGAALGESQALRGLEVAGRRAGSPLAVARVELGTGYEPYRVGRNVRTLKTDWGTYATESGKEYASRAEADLEQGRIDAARWEGERRRREEEAKMRHDPTLWETATKSVGAGFLRTGAGLLDAMQALSSGLIVEDASSPTGYTKTRSYEEALADKDDPLTRATGSMHGTADRLSEEAQPHSGRNGFLDMLWDGEIGGFLQKGIATAGESLPMTLSAANPYTMVLNAISMAGANFRENTLENPDVPAWKRASQAIGSAAIEQAVEKYADPIFKYVGGGKILRGASKGASGKISTEVTKDATETLAKRIYGRLKGLGRDALGEGAEEVMSNVGNDVLGETLDLVDGNEDYGLRAQWDELKKERPDADPWDFARAKAKENVEAFIGGAMAGAYTSGTAQLSAKALQYSFDRLGGGSVEGSEGQPLNPFNVDVAQSYDDGYSEEETTELQDTKNLYELRQGQMADILGVDAGQVDEAIGDAVNFIGELQRLGRSDEIQPVLDYVNSKAKYDGMIERVRDDIDGRIGQSNKMADERTNHETGMIQGVTMKAQDANRNDRRAYVLSGNLVMLPDGTGIDHEKSGGSVLIRYGDTGEVEMVSPEAILNMEEPVDPEAEKMAAAEAIRQQFAAEAAARIDGTVAFAAGDTYTLTDGNGRASQVQVVANEDGLVDNGDGTVNVSSDGGQTVVAMHKEDIQAMVDATNRARVAAPLADQGGSGSADGRPNGANGADRPNGANGTMADGLGLWDEVALRGEDGSVTQGFIIDDSYDDGTVLVQVDTPQGKRVVPYTREELDRLRAVPDENFQQDGGISTGNGNNGGENIGSADLSIPQDGNIEPQNIPEGGSVGPQGIPESMPKAIGRNRFGDIYQWTLGRFQSAASFLRKIRSGYLKGVFHRDGIGDIDMIWGNGKAGLEHIIKKHIEEADDFSSIDDAMEVIDRTIRNGTESRQGTNISFDYGGYRVSVAQSDEGNWVLTAFDATRSRDEKRRSKGYATIGDQGISDMGNGTLVSPQLASRVGKVSENSVNAQGNVAGNVLQGGSVGPQGIPAPAETLQAGGAGGVGRAGRFGRAEGPDGPGRFGMADGASAEGASALGRIPKDGQGQPLYEEADADTAWDAILEQSGDDEEVTGEVVADLVEERGRELKAAEKELKKAQEGRPQQGKGDAPLTMEERIAAKKAAKEQLGQAQANVEQAQARLAAWQEIARTPERRKQAALAEQSRAAEEAARLRRAEEEKERAEREEAERIRREALNGVPDFVEDAPQATGGDTVGGSPVALSYLLENGKGTIESSGYFLHGVAAAFPDLSEQIERIRNRYLDEIPPSPIAYAHSGHASIGEIRNLVNSVYGERGVGVFDRLLQNADGFVPRDGAVVGKEIEELMPIYGYTLSDEKAGNGERFYQRQDGNINLVEIPKEIFDSIGYAAAPFRLTPSMVRHTIARHGKETGLSTEQEAISFAMDVMTNFDHVRLGYDGALVFSIENGRSRTGKRAVTVLINSEDGEFYGLKTSGYESIRGLKKRPLLWERGAKEKTSATDAASASVTTGKSPISGERSGSASLQSNNLLGKDTELIPILQGNGRVNSGLADFQNGNTHLEEMFGVLPAKAQKAILATAYRDYDSPNAERMMDEIQSSIQAYYALSQDPAFANAKNYKEARIAVETWKRQLAFDDVTGESYLPSERYSNFALLLATMYKGQSQTFIQNTFKRIYDLVQGTQEATLFETPDNTPRTLVNAIEETLNNLSDELLLNGNFIYNGQRRNNLLAGGSAAGQRGRQGSDGSATAGGRDEGGTRTSGDNRRIESKSKQEKTDNGSDGLRDNDRRGTEIRPDARQSDLAQTGNVRRRKTEEYPLSQEDTQPRQEERVDRPTIDPRSMTDTEKKRRGDMLRNAPSIEVDEGQITSTAGLSARKVAEKWWNTNVPEPVFYDTEIGEVEINRNSVESSLAHRYSQAKLDAITSLVDGFENAVYLGTLPDFTRQDGVLSHYFAYPIIYKGKRCYVFCRAMQDANKNRLYVHEVFVAENIKRGDTLQTAASQPHGGIALYKDILGNVLEETPEPTNSSTDVDSNLSGKSDDTATRQSSDVSVHKDTDKSAVTQTISEKVAKAEEETATNPTEAQKEAGNYKKGHVRIGQFDITVENPKGSVRRGTDVNGKAWEQTMRNTYGYIRGTEGVDGDHIDVFLTNDMDGWNGRRVYIVDQYNEDGTFDEHKVMLGFNDEAEAQEAYLSNYEKGWASKRKLVLSSANLGDFERWINSSHRKTKPFAEYKSVNKTNGANGANTQKAGFEIAPAQYTTKRGKVLDMHLVKFDKPLTKEQQRAAKELAKAEKGWYDRDKDGFMMRSEESARKLADTITENEEAVSDAQPLSIADTRKLEEPEAIGTGAFGNIYDQFRGKAKEAIAFLRRKKSGEALGALHHDEIGDIDLVWGKEGTGHRNGFGLAKLVKFHPEVLDNLQEILDDMRVVNRSDNRINLESDTHKAAVRLEWDGKRKNWLLTAFEKENSVRDNTTDTGTSPKGYGNDTATPENTVLGAKDSEKSSDKQKNIEISNNSGQFGLVSDERMEEAKEEDVLYRTDDIDENFNEQLERWNNGEMGANEYIVAGNPSGVLRLFMPDVPIILRQKVLSKSRKKHELTIDDLQDLPSALATPIFVFKSSDNTVSVLTELESGKDENIFVAIQIGANKQIGHNILEVNDILTIHGREIENVINPIIENDSLVWADKKKGLNWLSSAKSNSQAIANKALVSAANIVRNFENPSVDGGNLREGGIINGPNRANGANRADGPNRPNGADGPVPGGKAGRTRKLRGSRPVEITGEEYKGKYELNRESAKQWIKDNLRGEYKIDDTGEVVSIGRKGVNKVTSHSMGNEAHLKSLVAIPQMLKSAVFIAEENAEKPNAQYPKYRYYAVGLKIGDADYTAKITVGVDENGNKFYDHSLTDIEKGNLIEIANGFMSTGAGPGPSVAGVKDTKLLSILQGNGGENSVAVEETLFRDGDGGVLGFARKHGLNQEDVEAYADYMARGNLNGAARAFHEIRRKVRLDNQGASLGAFTKIFLPIERELYEKFGDIDVLRQQYVQRALDERNAMEAARRRAEEAAEAERRRLQEFQDMGDVQLDSEYMKAAEANDEGRMRDLVNEAARRKGYGDAVSDYQGAGAWAAPSNPGYESDAARREALATDGCDVNVEDIAEGYSSQPGDYFTNLRAYGNDTPHGKESAKAINGALAEIRNGGNPKVKVYRAVPRSVKEGNVRNGDWVTPSRKYAEMHGENRLGGDYRIIEQDVAASELWWDGNDINEWGFDDGKVYAYRNTRNNRKLNDLITRDDEGRIIPPSQRFNARKADVRYRLGDALYEVNERFNEELEGLTEENADRVALSLGKPSAILRAAGVEDKPMKLYGNKVIKKMKKHGFSLDELRNLPEAVANPIAVFNNYQKDGNRSILTEMAIGNKNVLVSITVGQGNDVDFNIVSSVFGKGKSNIIDWINKGYATYINKKKTLDYLHFSERSIPEASNSRDGKALNWFSSASPDVQQEITNTELISAANIVKNFENPNVSDENLRLGNGVFTDDDLSNANDPVSKLLGKSTRTARQRRAFAERERGRIVERVRELAETLHLDNVDIVTDASTLQGNRAKAKGFFSRSTGRITIVIPNQTSVFDAEQTLLHEAVAHYGLRELFGEHFDTFLDNVFQSADADVRRHIVELAERRGWDFRTATEEYLASLAENTNFENVNAGWWSKVKELFLRMLHKIGFEDFSGVTLYDNELRYILWRSYENLAEPGGYRSILGEAADVAKQYELKVGNYAAGGGRSGMVIGEPGAEAANGRFNAELAGLTEENADRVALSLGRPSAILRAAGVEDKPMKLYGAKVIKKMKKHGFKLGELRNLPEAVANPIAVFDNYKKQTNRAILTELKTAKGNFLVTLDVGKGEDIDFNIISSVFGKGKDNIVDWIERGLATYINKEKALNYLHHSALSAEALSSPRLISAANIVKNFENPRVDGGNLREGGIINGPNRANGANRADGPNRPNGADWPVPGGKAWRTRKLRGSRPVEITGEEIEPSDDLKQYKKNALEYGKRLQGSYTNKDTGITIQLQRGRRNGGINEVLQHDYKDVEHLQSIAAIPQIIENSVYIDSRANIDTSKNPDVKEYMYYVCGLKIGGVDYTVRSTVAVDKNGNRYYDHKLTHIEKGRLLDLINGQAAYDNGFGTTPGTKPTTEMPSGYKDKTLLSILQGDGEENLLYRDGGVPSGADGGVAGEAAQVARRMYEDAVRDTGSKSLLVALAMTLRSKEDRVRFRHKFAESYFDYSRSVKALQDATERSLGRKLLDFEKPWEALNAKSSVDSVEVQEMMLRYLEPLSRHIGAMVSDKKLGGRAISLDDVEKYMNAKHGPERNAHMAERELSRLAAGGLEKWRARETSKLLEEGYSREEAEAIAEGEAGAEMRRLREELWPKVRHDYAGLTALFGGEVGGGGDVDALEAAASRYCAEFERAVGVEAAAEMWRMVRALNGFSLRKAYLSGLIGKEQYDEVSGEYEYYVPLRGWHDDYAGDVYQYVSRGMDRGALQGVLKSAYGRKSRAGAILGTMAAMANTAIVQGNRNLVGQKLLNLALNTRESGLLMVSRQWYEMGADGEYVARHPALREGMGAEEMQSAIEEHDMKMQAAASSGDAKVVHKSFGKEFPLHAARWEEQQHGVRVLRNGREYMVYVLGNPKAAQALNGMLNPDVRAGAVEEALMRYLRYLAMVQTSLSPEFPIQNFQRDVLTSLGGAYVKHGLGYARRYAKALWRVLPATGGAGSGGIFGLLGKFRAGRLDLSVPMERMFMEFMSHGGKTGISEVFSTAQYERRVGHGVARARRGRVADAPEAAVRGLLGGIQFLNDGIENATRFAAFVTAREGGASIGDAVSEAKNASVNFNMKGSGAWGNLWMRRYIIYSNAALQSLRMLGTWWDASPKRFMGLMSATLATSFAMALVCHALGGGDGDDDGDDYGNEWYRLSEWDRYNYVNVPVVGGYLHWSIPQEFRPAWALGQIAFDWQHGRIGTERALHSMAMQLNNLTPVSFIAGGTDTGDSWITSAVRGWTPTVAADFMDAYVWNEDYLGRPITGQHDWNSEAPEWQRVTDDTPGWAVGLSRRWNEATGGREHRKSWWDSEWLNPGALYHLLKQQAGGVGTLVTKCTRLGEQWRDPESEVEARNIPFVSKLYVSSDGDASKDRVLNDKFYQIWNEWRMADYELRRIRSDYENGRMTEAEHEAAVGAMEADGSLGLWEMVYENGYDMVYDDILEELKADKGDKKAKEDLRQLKRDVVEMASPRQGK